MQTSTCTSITKVYIDVLSAVVFTV
jgi:hypothetical protein